MATLLIGQSKGKTNNYSASKCAAALCMALKWHKIFINPQILSLGKHDTI